MSPSLCTVAAGSEDTRPADINDATADAAADASAKLAPSAAAATSAAADSDDVSAPARGPPSPPPSPGVPPTAVPLCRPPSVCTPDPTSAAAAATAAAGTASAAVDWSRVRLGVDAAPTMFIASWSPDTGRWDGGQLVPYGPLSLLPAAQVLNYGQSIFEGLKAYRHDGGAATGTSAGGASGASAGECGERRRQEERVLLFRADANAARFHAGAVRMCMPPVPPAMFLAAVQAVVRANVAWVPPASRGSLYLRPLLLGTGPLLGLCPAPSYTFLVYAVPVGSRAKEGRLVALDYLIHDSLHRAAPRGVGSTKAAGNYSPCLQAQAEARAAGCHECIYLDAKSDTYLEEGSGCNVFTVTHGSVITTPPAAGSILPGITRQSLMQLAEALGYRVREAPITVGDAMGADEMFGTGTAVVVQPIGSVTFKGRRVQFCRGGDGGGAANGNGTAAAAAGAAPLAGNGTSGSSCGCEAEPEESVKDAAAGGAADVDGAAAGGGGFGGGRSVSELLPEECSALAAAAPVPEPGSLPAGVGPVAQRLYGLLTSIQYGRAPDVFRWTLEVDMAGPTEGPLRLDELLDEQDEISGADVVSGQNQAGSASQDPAAALVAGAKGKGKGKGPAASAVPRTVFADPNLE
ncbi:hypothetical protein PLESTM_000104000 [Pleodorina starrii]|nr:hypothetical protein PLESTM_000104000 [Pleodorina starrii]